RPDHVVAGLLLLEHHPHRLDVLLGVAPVAPDVEVAEGELVPPAELDLGDTSGDSPGDEGGAAPRRLVVEEDPGARVHAEALPEVDGDEVAVDLRDPVGTAGVKRSSLALG